MTRKFPSEALQISAQSFVVEMARHTAQKNGIPLDDALRLSVSATRKCLERTGVVQPNATLALEQTP